MKQIAFVVYAKAEPQGSKKGFVSKGRAVVVDVSGKKMKSYRNELTRQAMYELDWKGEPMAGKHEPVELVLEFMFLKPKTCPRKRIWPVVTPDIDKLLRSTCDALTGVLYADDAQIVGVRMQKVYGPIEQVKVSARIMTEVA